MFRSVYLSLFAVSVVGCGGGGGGGDGDGISNQQIVDSGIDGTWVSRCQISTGNTSLQATLRFGENGDQKTELRSYSDPQCAEQTSLLSTEGSFVVGQVISSADFGVLREFDAVYTKSFVTFQGQSFVDTLNDSGVDCPTNNFELNVTYDQSSCGAVFNNRQLPVTAFQTFVIIDGTRLVFSEYAYAASDRIADVDISSNNFLSYTLQ